MEGWEIIQQCAEADGYNKDLFIKLISDMGQADFNRFCRQYLYLDEFYNSNVNAYVTDYTPLIAANPTLYWRLIPIDFNAPINFSRIK